MKDEKKVVVSTLHVGSIVSAKSWKSGRVRTQEMFTLWSCFLWTMSALGLQTKHALQHTKAKTFSGNRSDFNCLEIDLNEANPVDF